MSAEFDAVVVGSGPNGLAAAITLARAGCSVLVVEAHDHPGGGMRSLELTLPGFVHDVCAAIHPLALASPFFKELPLHEHGLAWVYPDAEVAHPFENGPAVLVERDLEATAQQFGVDAAAYRRLVRPYARAWHKVIHDFLGPLRIPRYPAMFVRFGVPALLPAATLARLAFQGERARAVFAGMAGHSLMPLEHAATGAFGLMLLMLSHSVGWPLARGGSQAIADALVGYLKTLGGRLTTGQAVRSIDELPPARLYMLSVTPRQMLRMAGERLSPAYRRQLARYRYAPGAFKVDYALSSPIPWHDPAVARAATVHVGGTLDEIAASERAPWNNHPGERPFVLLAQPSLFDDTRTPDGGHTAWTYCHVPNGSDVNMTARMEAQIERFAPGFTGSVLARHTHSAAAMELYNANYIGGDINGGVQDLRQLFTRPAVRVSPYSTPDPAIYICSASTPPGGGIHGLSGYFAALAALRRNGLHPGADAS